MHKKKTVNRKNDFDLLLFLYYRKRACQMADQQAPDRNYGC